MAGFISSFSDVLGTFSEHRYLDDGIDRLNRIYTPVILISTASIMGVIQFVGDPIEVRDVRVWGLWRSWLRLVTCVFEVRDVRDWGLWRVALGFGTCVIGVCKVHDWSQWRAWLRFVTCGIRVWDVRDWGLLSTRLKCAIKYLWPSSCKQK